MLDILLVHHGVFFAGHVGGAETSIRDFAEHAQAAGARVVVLAERRGPDQVQPVERGAPFGYPVFHAIEPLKVAPRIYEGFKPDITFAQSIRCRNVAEIGMARGVPAAIYIHDTIAAGYEGVVGPHPAILHIANSRFSADRARALFGIEGAPVIPPIVDPARYRLEQHEPREVLLVNPIYEKGQEIALRLAAAFPQVPFRFVEGWTHARDDMGPRNAELADRVLRLPNVTVYPNVDDMRIHYARTRLLLAPSIVEEGWGRAVTEAQTLGIPALVSDRGGLPEAVGQAGTVVPAHAPFQAWVEAFGRIWNDAGTYARMAAAAGAAMAAPERDPGRMARGILTLLARHRQGAAPLLGSPAAPPRSP